MNLIRGHHRDVVKFVAKGLQSLLDYDDRVREGKHTSDGIEVFPVDEGTHLGMATTLRDYLERLLETQA